MSYPEDRIPLFLNVMRELCAEAGLPCYDDYGYDRQQEALVVLWQEPEFCLGIPLRTASIHGMTAEHLRSAWVRKFGGDWEQRLARRRAAGKTL